MICLQTTQALRSALGIGGLELDGPQDTASLFGNWFVSVARIGDRQAFVFMSARTLLSFPIMIGMRPPSIEDLPAFLQHGLMQMLDTLGGSRESVARLMTDLEQVAVCRATDRSLLATMQPLIAAYQRAGDGPAPVDLGRVIMRINEQPRAMLRGRSAFDVSRDLLRTTGCP